MDRSGNDDIMVLDFIATIRSQNETQPSQNSVEATSRPSPRNHGTGPQVQPLGACGPQVSMAQACGPGGCMAQRACGQHRSRQPPPNMHKPFWCRGVCQSIGEVVHGSVLHSLRAKDARLRAPRDPGGDQTVDRIPRHDPM